MYGDQSETQELTYLYVLAVLNRTSGIPFHVSLLKEKGATRDEVISAILVGLVKEEQGSVSGRS